MRSPEELFIAVLPFGQLVCSAHYFRPTSFPIRSRSRRYGRGGTHTLKLPPVLELSSEPTRPVHSPDELDTYGRE